jgi:aldose sugar dehydrogenase
MNGTAVMSRAEKIRLIVFPSLLAAVLGFLLSSNTAIRPAQAFSSGPPAGYTGAPGEEPEACAECHVPVDAGTGHITITAPQTYIPGQTYQITVTHTNPDPTRIRWGFELTVLDTSDEKAGELQNLDGLTQILNNAGPGSARQYIEHTGAGTFIGQQNTASWTFNWTAPAIDIGVVTFYAAGNQANNDGNTSGDYIYKTFVAAAPFSATPDFDLGVTPPLRSVVPTASAEYNLTITPSAGFTGTVNPGVIGLPSGASATFNPASINITDASAKTSTLTITTGAGTPLGDYPITVNGSSGSLMHSKQVALKVISPASIDLAVTKSASPNPGQVGLALSYRITVTNNGPAIATNVSLTDTLPAGVVFGSASSTVGLCGGTGPVVCAIGSLPVNASAVITIAVTPSTPGQIANSATVTASETDNDAGNNTTAITTEIQPAAVAPSMLDPNLTVTTLVSGLDQPIALAFPGPNDLFVLEKASGKVKFVQNGIVQATAIDLAVNSASERGLLGIALHPNFASNHFVYLYWTESSTGSDSTNLADVTLLGNRVDRYIWNGTLLTFDRNLIQLRAYQADANQPLRGNHNGGVLRFGPDGKLYILMGDNGRRGFLQNNQLGPVPDDQYGGPEPDNAHLTGFVLRLNYDGSTPTDNPFFNAATTLTGQAAANTKKIYAYGVRNGFGLAFDPLSGILWDQENGDDAFDEMNRITPGSNNGWVETMGPASRVAEYKAIESTYGAGNLQQLRWAPSLIADTPAAALASLYMLPGAHYNDPEFSWKYALAPAGMGFVEGRGLGTEYEGDLLVGASRTTLLNGYLFRFKFTPDRKHFKFTDSLLADLVADSVDKFDLTESETLLVGRDFGVATDIQTGPNGNVFVTSLLNGAIYEIKSKPSTIFYANLTGAQEVPPTNSTATGTATLVLSPDETNATLSLNFSGLSSAQTDAHIHGPAPVGSTAPPIFPLAHGQISDYRINLTPAQAQDLKNGLWYINVHSTNFPNGEIRGQFQTSATASTVQFGATQLGVGEGEGSATLTVTRSGNVSEAADVNYATLDPVSSGDCSLTDTGSALAPCDYMTTLGSLHFAAGQSLATISIPIVDDAYAEGSSESFIVALNNASGSGVVLSSPSTIIVTINDNETVNGTNPIDNAEFFVRQHYLDFLNREPDPSGFNFWTHQIIDCGSDAQCIEIKRINVSAAFFLSIEFQESSNFIYRLYKGTLARKPNYAEFKADRSKISFDQNFLPNTSALAYDFVGRPEFTNKYPENLGGTHFIDALLQTINDGSGVDLSGSRSELYAAYDNCLNLVGGVQGVQFCKAYIVQRVVNDGAFRQGVFSESFVLMEYFGYLRRNPNDPPDVDFSGYNFWLNKLNQFNGNFVDAEMVKAFIISGEYRQRFGP